MRLKLLEQFKDNENFKIDIVEDINNVNKFNYLENSVFTLCPGEQVLHRLGYESMSSGSIPIYVSDTFGSPLRTKLTGKKFVSL